MVGLQRIEGIDTWKSTMELINYSVALAWSHLSSVHIPRANKGVCVCGMEIPMCKFPMTIHCCFSKLFAFWVRNDRMWCSQWRFSNNQKLPVPLTSMWTRPFCIQNDRTAWLGFGLHSIRHSSTTGAFGFCPDRIKVLCCATVLPLNDVITLLLMQI